jgi:hypothetical protein
MPGTGHGIVQRDYTRRSRPTGRVALVYRHPHNPPREFIQLTQFGETLKYPDQALLVDVRGVIVIPQYRQNKCVQIILDRDAQLFKCSKAPLLAISQ